MIPPASDHPPPTRAPRIEQEGELARGGMSAIRRVRDTVLERTAAMKVLDVSLEHPQLEARFLREAQILAQLDHPHIVPLYELGRDDDGAPCFTMKLIEGQTLSELVSARDPVVDQRELQRVLEILIKVCDALAFAHSRGVIHRDVKPDNVMVGSHGQVYVMDWGVARILSDAQLEAAGVARHAAVRCDRSLEHDDDGVVGTPSYMPPEQAWGRADDVDQRADVFGVGGLLYFVLTGAAPHRADDVVTELALARAAAIRAPQEVVPARALPRGLCTVAMRALAADRERRHPTIAALRADLERYLRAGIFQTRQFPAGATIIREQDGGDTAYILARGRCEASKLEGGRAITLRQMGPGDVFGEMALLTGSPRSATVVALDDVTVLAVSRDALDEWLALDQGLGRLVRSLAERFRDLDGQQSQLRRDHLKLRVREQLITAVVARGRTPWAPLCARLARETQLGELDLLAIASDFDDLALDPTGQWLTLVRR